MATSWKNVRAARTMRKGDMILGLNDGKTDAEIWEKFNAEIDADVVSDYMAEFCGILTETKRGFPDGSVIKKSTCNTGDAGSIPGLGRSPEDGNGNTLQYS